MARFNTTTVVVSQAQSGCGGTADAELQVVRAEGGGGRGGVSGVVQICNLRAVAVPKRLVAPSTQATASRRYSRLQTCATQPHTHGQAKGEEIGHGKTESRRVGPTVAHCVTSSFQPPHE